MTELPNEHYKFASIAPDNKIRCDYCEREISKPIIQRCITFCDPVLVLRFCSEECSIRWEADAFATGVKKRRYLFPQGVNKKKYLKEFLPIAIAHDKEIGINNLSNVKLQNKLFTVKGVM